MNRKKGVLLLFLSVLFAACSSDEQIVDEGKDNNGQELGYIAVNIVQPKSAGVRDASQGFQYGDEGENKASNALFFIFKTNGDLFEEPIKVSHLDGSGTSTSPEVERIYNAVLVISGRDDDPTEAKKLVCVLNASDGLETQVQTIRQSKTLTISDLQKLIGKYENHTDGTFIMSNSVYTTDGNIAEAIISGNDVNSNIRKSESEALAHPVNIYVERVVARVDASVGTGKKLNNEGASVAINGAAASQLGIKVTGIEIANIADESYLFKNVNNTKPATGLWSANFWDDLNKRSYWEVVPSINTSSVATTTEVINEKLDFKNRSYNDILALHSSESPFDINTVTHKEYIQPNTSDTKTCVLVTAQLTQNNIPITNLAYIRGGYTTTDDAKKVVARHLAETKNWYKKKTVTTEGATTKIEYIQLEPTDFEWKNKYDFTGDAQSEVSSWLKDYEVVAQLHSGENAITEIYNRNGELISDGVNAVNSYLRAKDATNDGLAKKYCARVFTDGMCYYFVNIDHSNAVNANAGTYYGVVRNHLYKLTLESIKGIGTPIYDPEDIIIPQTTDKETAFFMSAKIHVLAWKLVTQGIAFGE